MIYVHLFICKRSRGFHLCIYTSCLWQHVCWGLVLKDCLDVLKHRGQSRKCTRPLESKHFTCLTTCYLGNRFCKTRSKNISIERPAQYQSFAQHISFCAHPPQLYPSHSSALLGLHLLLCFPLFRGLGLVRYDLVGPGITIDLILFALPLLR